MSKKIINQHHKEISLRIHFSDLYFEKKNFDENSVKSTSDNKIDKNILFQKLEQMAHLHVHAYIYTHTCTYIYIYVFISLDYPRNPVFVSYVISCCKFDIILKFEINSNLENSLEFRKYRKYSLHLFTKFIIQYLIPLYSRFS